MHETVVAENVLRTILEHAEKLKARPVRAVVSCGQFNALNEEAMKFAFETAAAGTVCQGMLLQIRQIPLRASCRACRTLFELNLMTPLCPQCRSEDFDIEPDAPLLLEEIEFEDKQ
ncbi:MAG TPA: hydrogenase maturation nickel metallochaperone HypA [Anaerohalosphaeraceae bacterium]|nr:hydrogenase maturation nickel metallochaperone HypA [Anaerohalosphaeraceae bacterium]HOL87800.1 hydrogenase maturation nickel metallochaperone HypA [Anaerohalosphaeraceae bacterium]HPP55152.1 hydrogenase maturation nickel metallochaperone HypA [Anaerohalosphaeraceae bacterium]